MSVLAELRLVPLDCPTCGEAVEAEGDDVVYYCTACRNGYRFHTGKADLVPTEVSFVSAPNVSAELYLPFWLLPARVELLQRDARGKSFSGLMGLFMGTEHDEGGRRREGTFAVPAFHTPLRAAARLTRRYTEQLPQLGERLGERLLGGRYGVEDAQKLAHYALIASEVEKPDLLKQLRYEIEFGTARLLGVPFVAGEKGLADAVFGIRV